MRSGNSLVFLPDTRPNRNGAGYPVSSWYEPYSLTSETLLVRNDLENADLNSEMRVTDEQNQQTFVVDLGSDLSV